MAVMDEIVVPVRAEFQGLTVRPGDKLIIAFNRPLDMEEAESVASRLRDEFDGVSVTVVDNVAGMAVYRP